VFVFGPGGACGFRKQICSSSAVFLVYSFRVLPPLTRSCTCDFFCHWFFFFFFCFLGRQLPGIPVSHIRLLPLEGGFWTMGQFPLSKFCLCQFFLAARKSRFSSVPGPPQKQICHFFFRTLSRQNDDLSCFCVSVRGLVGLRLLPMGFPPRGAELALDLVRGPTRAPMLFF